MSRYDHKIEPSLEGIEHLSKEMKGKNAITVETQKHDKKNTSDRKDILFEKQAILLDTNHLSPHLQSSY